MADEPQTTTENQTPIAPQPASPAIPTEEQTPPSEEPKPAEVGTPPETSPEPAPISEQPTEPPTPLIETQTEQTTPEATVIPPENSQPESPAVETPSEQNVPNSPTSPDLHSNFTSTHLNPLNNEEPNIPDLTFPFYGDVSPSLNFGEVPNDDRIKQKFSEWGIVGHNGIDFPLETGTEVLACYDGKVIQTGDNGDFGTSVTIQHSWGQSLYAHLQETEVAEGDEVKAGDVIGLSGETGAAFGAHLHFAIQPLEPKHGNGYLGFIDPAPYLKNHQPIPETPQTPEPTQTPQPNSDIPPSSSNSSSPSFPSNSSVDLEQAVAQKFTEELNARRQKATAARQTKRENHLAEIEQYLQKHSTINNDEVRDLLHVSKTTASDYLSTLVKSGRIKVEGKAKATVYKNIFS